MRYTGQSGHTESDDRRTSTTWEWPDWTDADLAKCAAGKHKDTRKRLVAGWIGYFSQVDHYYCACGSHRWIWFQTGWAEENVGEPGMHEQWLDAHLRVHVVTPADLGHTPTQGPFTS